MYYVYVVELEGICLDYLFLPEYKHIIGIILLQYLNSLNYFAGFSFLNTIACSNEHGKIQYNTTNCNLQTEDCSVETP